MKKIKFKNIESADVSFGHDSGGHGSDFFDLDTWIVGLCCIVKKSLVKFKDHPVLLESSSEQNLLLLWRWLGVYLIFLQIRNFLALIHYPFLHNGCI